MTTTREAAEKIENGLRNLIKEDFSNIVIRLAKEEGISITTSSTYIGDIGDIHRRLDPSSKSNKDIHLKRLNTLYSILNIPENDLIILNTQIINPNFKYIPRNFSKF